MLYRKGCQADIYIPMHMKQFFKTMFRDNLKIVLKDADYLSLKLGKKVQPLYTEKDVETMLDYMIEIEANEIIEVNKHMSIRYTPNYHILHSMQIEVFVQDGNYRKVIAYTGDVGNISLKNKPFVTPLAPIEKCDILICETTYAMKKKKANQKIRDKDIEKIKTCVRETCIEDKTELLIASFAMQRLQELLVDFYKLYGEDPNFNIPVLIDSPLSISLTKLFEKDGVLPKQEQELIRKILSWKNLKLINEWRDSSAWQQRNEPKIVFACSGFCVAGRIRPWLQKVLPNEKARVMFVGYNSPESLGGIIREGKVLEIEIDRVKCKNRCKVTNLLSYSSHIQHDDMLEYYSNVNAREIYLVHGEYDNRFKFAKLLDEKLKQKCKTTKVYVAHKNLEIEV